jgi:L-threonylcarbamoyladenylate synthase
MFQRHGKATMDRLHISDAARAIREGKLVAFPTETVYGLGANAFDPIAVARIYEAKERPSFDPLIVHIADISDLEMLMLNADQRVYDLAARFWPGPLTMVVPKSKYVPDIVTSGLPTVGIRIPHNEIALALIQVSGCPVAAPSANKFGRISPTTAAHVRKQLPDVEFILDGGSTTVGIESTIINITRKGFQMLRHGAVTHDEIEELLPCDKDTIIGLHAAPGMMKSHYSPEKPFVVASPETLPCERAGAGLISFSGAMEEGFRKIIRSTEKGDLKEYAVKMFAAMHAFEEDPDINLIVAEAVPEQGIGKAIMDRLRKAAYDWRK